MVQAECRDVGDVDGFPLWKLLAKQTFFAKQCFVVLRCQSIFVRRELHLAKIDDAIISMIIPFFPNKSSELVRFLTISHKKIKL